MTYSLNGLIQASDVNGFTQNNTPNVNSVWSTGSGNRGYGQTALPTVAIGDTVLAATFANLLNTVGTTASHQNTTLSPYINGTPSVGDIIKYESTLTSNINLIDTYRLNARAQSPGVSQTLTNSTAWNDYLTFTHVLTFNSQNRARYFFNGGGQITLSLAHTYVSGSNDAIVHDLCLELGTIYLSSTTSGSITISGLNFNGVTKVGGNPARGTVYQNNGFYAWTTSDILCYDQQGSSTYSYYYSSANIKIYAKSSGTGIITITVTIDGIPSTPNVTGTTTCTATQYAPSTSYIANTWGIPVFSGSVTRV